MKTAHSIIGILVVLVVAGGGFGCAEIKIGVGPFKAGSVEAGPGGIEAKGPSAGPFKTKGAEVSPSGKAED